MKLDFLTLYPEAFGLDVSDRSFKIAKLKKTRNGYQLSSFGEFPLPEGLIAQGEIQNEDEVARLLKEAVRSLKLQTPFVVSSLPEEKAFLQVLQLPKMKEAEVKQAVLFEAENYIPYSIDTVYLDSMYVPPLKNSLDHMDVLLAALPKSVVDSYVNCFRKAGLTARVLEIESMATARALVADETAEAPLLLLDMEATRTGFAVFAGTSLRFTASIPVSGSQLTRALASALSVSEEEAEELKKTQGIQESLFPLLQELLNQGKKYVGYYESHSSHQHLQKEEKRIRKLLLAGGGANLKGLAEFFQKELEVPVEIGNPWVNIFKKEQKELPPLPLDQSLQYTTALGLALRGMKSHD